MAKDININAINLRCFASDFRSLSMKSLDKIETFTITLSTLNLGTLNKSKAYQMIGLIAHVMLTFVCNQFDKLKFHISSLNQNQCITLGSFSYY